MAKSSQTKEQESLRFWERSKQAFPKTFLWVKRISLGFLLIFMMDIGYLIGIWPNWDSIEYGPIPKSRFIQEYEIKQAKNPTIRKLSWSTIPFENIPRNMIRAVLAAEDYKFFDHNGVDTDALLNAIEYNWHKKRIVYGASTITQQTVKNLFLSGSKNPLRKWHEYLLTFAMEQNLSKKRILEIYLNIAEFGRGTYGIESAAQRYWKKSASNLSRLQAIELAASLPAPKKHNPSSRTDFFMTQRNKIKNNI